MIRQAIRTLNPSITDAMKLIHKYLILGVAAAGAFTACDNYDADDRKFDNVVPRRVEDRRGAAGLQQQYAHGRKADSGDAGLSRRADVAVSLTVDPSLVATYNARYGSDWKMLDAKYYELSSDNVTIHAGKTASEVVTLRLKGLMGEGEQQTGALPIDETYLLPVHLPFVDVGAERLRGRLLRRQTLFGHHRRGAAHGHWINSVARQVRRQQHAVE